METGHRLPSARRRAYRRRRASDSAIAGNHSLTPPVHDPLTLAIGAGVMSAIVERFLSWARGAPVARRREAAAMLARAFLVSPISPAERDEIEGAMTVLLDDAALEVRLALAGELARSERAPHHLILSLAADHTPVAALVAEHSPLILDSELVDLAATREEPVQVAIARRPFLSRAVAAALAEVGSPAACLALVANRGARLLRFSLDRLVERHGDCPELRSALLEREDLPVDVRQLLVARLADALRDLAVQRSWLSAERAKALMADARECATIAIAFETAADQLPALAAELMRTGELTPAFLIRAVAAGQTTLFEAGLAALAGVPGRRVNALIASGRAASLRALLQKAGLPPRTFSVFIAAVDVIRRGDAAAGAASDYRRATQLVDAILARHEERRDRELDEILALLRRFATTAKRTAARDYAEQVLQAA
jgi:uncharacterized protein (DUF2336 family)